MAKIGLSQRQPSGRIDLRARPFTLNPKKSPNRFMRGGAARGGRASRAGANDDAPTPKRAKIVDVSMR